MLLFYYFVGRCPECGSDLLQEDETVEPSLTEEGRYHTMVNGRGERFRVLDRDLYVFLCVKDLVA